MALVVDQSDSSGIEPVMKMFSVSGNEFVVHPSNAPIFTSPYSDRILIESDFNGIITATGVATR